MDINANNGARWTHPWCLKTRPLYPVHGAPAWQLLGYKCSFTQLKVESSIIAYGSWKNTIFTRYYVIILLT